MKIPGLFIVIIIIIVLIKIHLGVHSAFGTISRKEAGDYQFAMSEKDSSGIKKKQT